MAKIKKIKLGTTTYDLCDADAVHVVKQDGITGATVNRFGTCATAAATPEKAVSITTGTFNLEAGAKVTVKFSNKNTAGTPTLNVSSTGAKNIFHNGAKITTGGNKALLAGTVEFVYDGTQWHLIGNYVDSHNSHTLSSGTKADGTTEIIGASSSGKLVLGTSGVTQSTYGPTTDPAPAQSGTFAVPSITVNDKGIVTAAATKTVTLPDETALSIVDKKTSSTEKDTTDLVYVVSNLTEGGTKNHTITPIYSGMPTKAYVDKVAAGHVKYLGTVTALTGLATTAGQGDFYRVSTAFTFGSETAHVGDIILATKDNPAQNTTDWDLIHTEVDQNTWVANTKTAAGYVAAPTDSNPNKVWRTDGAGSPAWRDPSTPEAFLTWGGRNFTGAYGPIDAAMIPQLGANRFAFFPKANVTLEYSTNSGSTWTALNNDDKKAALFSTGGASFYIGNNTAKKIDKTAYMCRVTLTTSGVCYSVLNKFAIYISTGGSSGCYCTLDARTKANQDAGNNSWTTFASRVPLEGWSGWNIINTSGVTTHGNRTDQYSQLRFTFGVTSHAATVNYEGLSISRIMAFGGVGWNTPSNMAASGDIYSYDKDQNVTFPGSITAPKFIGKLQGKADALANTSAIGSSTNPVYFTADGVPAACTYSLNKTVPSEAVFTDTKVTSVDNHYAPSAADGSELTASLSGTAGTYAKDTEYTVVTGIKVQRDAKGHVTGLTYTAQKIKDTNTNTNTTLSGVAYCSTAAATAAKTATMPGFALSSGQRIFLRTTVTNSATSSVTLNVNGTGAKAVKIGNSSTAPTASNFPAGDYIANYDGTNWVLTRIYLTDTDTNTWRGIQDNLTSTSTTDSLSAKQGKELKTLVDGKVTANTAITGATKCKITYDSKGLVTAGANLAATDIPNLAASKITSGTFDSARIPNLASSKITSMTSYSKASSAAAISTSDSLNTAMGKLEYKLDNTTELTVSSNNNTAEWGGACTVGTVAGTALKFTMPTQPTDNKVKVTTGTTTKAYILGVNSSGYSSGGATNNVITDTGVYLDTTAGQLTAKSFCATSDKRLKENLETYVPTHSILNLPVYKYNFISDEAKTTHIGCLAQDLQTICPEIVSEDAEGYLSINESKLTYLLLLEVKRLNAELEALKKGAN